jgi:mRNA interferase RelE/StbE
MLYSSYKINIHKRVQKFLDDLPKKEKEKFVLKINDLILINHHALPVKKLVGYKNVYRLKINDYRIIFALVSNQKMIVISVIGHRKEIYDIARKIVL